MRGAKKFEQIGVSAALKLLEGLLDAEVPCDVGGVVLLDLACGVGDFFWAWLERRAREFQSACARCKATTYPLLYMGATADGTACEWLRHVQSDEVLQKLAHGSLALPGYQQKSQEPPADLLQAPPVPPQLNLCVMKGGSLVLPEAQTQQWASHGTFGPQFQEVMAAQIVAEFGEPQAEEGPPRKRGAQDEQGGSGKRPKVAPTLDLRAVTSVAAGLAQAPVSGLKRDLAGKLVLRVCQDQSWWVMNMSEGKVSVAAGTTVAQFGHGAFKHVARGPEGQAGEADPQSVLFALNEDSDQVIDWGKLASVGEVVAGAAGSRSSVEICYHAMTENPTADNAAGFKLTRKHDLYYKPQPRATAEEKLSLEMKGTTAIAGLVAVETLTGFRQNSQVLWAVKWVTKGLSPIRPMVVTTVAMELEANTAVRVQ